LCRQRRMIEINCTARRVLAMMDGKRNLMEIIKAISGDYEISEDITRKDIQKLVSDLSIQGAIMPVIRLVKKRRKPMAETSSLLANPGVSLREEEDGAILFNADTNALLIINPIGMIIWQFIKIHPRSKADIVRHLQFMCDNVPPDQVQDDVDTFVADLQGKGFIGEVVDEKKA